MSSMRGRLLEALQVIREDRNHRNAIEAEKLARTQYREGFHLRRSAATTAHPVHVWRDDDTSDDDYSPGKKRRKLKAIRLDESEGDGIKSKKSRNRKRKIASKRTEGNGLVNVGDEGSLPKKQRPTVLDHNFDEDGYLNYAFTTLKLSSPNLQNHQAILLKNHPDTDINAYIINNNPECNDPSPYRSSSGGLHHGNKSMLEHEQDYEFAKATRMLRSGRVRAEITPKKRQKDENETETDTQREKHERSKRAKISCARHEYRTSRLDNVMGVCDQAIEPVQDWNLPPVNPRENKHSHGWDKLRSPVEKYQTAKDHKQQIGNSPINAIFIDDAPSTCGSNTPSPTSSLSTARGSSSTKTTPLTSPDNLHPIAERQIWPPKSHIVTLSTFFSHPINFKATAAESCTFHADYRHPILGYGVTTGQYLIYSNQPSQLIELGSGHRGNNMPEDIMCIKCAFSYLQITRCTRHTFEAIPSDPQTVSALEDNGRAYIEDLFTPKRGNPHRNTEALVPTCSLCPMPASWRCVEPQLKDKLQRHCRLPSETDLAARIRIERSLGQSPTNTDVSMTTSQETRIQLQQPIHGCGLLLCTSCMHIVRDTCGGRMEENRALVLRTVRKRPLKLRADAEFLFKEGLLWKAYHVDQKED